MKKSIIILTLLTILFLFGQAFAAPADVSIIPVSKWDYKNVDGWGFYAKNGEYSWFAFILRNKGNSDLTVTLPSKVDVAHNTSHEIVNTSYKAMINGSADFLYEGYTKVYFNNSFTLPKDSTYSVFFDVTDMQRYSKQWDTNVYFSVGISDGITAINLPITGVLAYDAKNTTPEKLTIVNTNTGSGSETAPSADPLTTVSFCRDYDSSTKKLYFAYTLKNNSGAVIPVELATTLEVQGRNKTLAITYISCTSGGSSCDSRIKNGIFKMDPGETAVFKAQAPLSKQPANSNFYIKTSLRYDYNGKTLIPFLVGYAAGSCTAPATPVPTAPVTTVTPAPGNDEPGLRTVSFCREYEKKTRKVSFSYTLKNISGSAIPVELATTLAVEGISDVVPVSYTACLSSGGSCASRISKGIITLNAGETAEFRGTATLPSRTAKTNFYIRTSLRYDYNGQKQIPFLVGFASDACSSGSAVIPDTEGDTGLVSVSFCRNFDADSRKVTFSYALRNKSAETIPVELATTLAVEGISDTVSIHYTACSSSGSSCATRISNGIFRMNPGETAVFSGMAALPYLPQNPNFYVKTSLRYDYRGRTLIPLLVGYTTNTCTAAHAVSADEIVQKAAESGDPLMFAVRIVNNKDTDMIILPGAIVQGHGAFGNYKGSASISAVDTEITGTRDISFKNDEAFTIPPHSVADITLSAGIDPAMIDPEEGELSWNYSIDTGKDISGPEENLTGSKGLTPEENKTEAKGLTPANTNANRTDSSPQLRQLVTPRPQGTFTIPNFERKP